MAGGDWSRVEVEVIVNDYFDMLERELRAEPFSKAEHRRGLISRLDGRTATSIEWKHRNISAILHEHGVPSIEGYKPAVNYQRNVLPEVVTQVLNDRASVLRFVESEVDDAATVPSVEDILRAMESPPELTSSDDKRARHSPARPERRINYLERESRNRSLGDAGEEFVLNYERARLVYSGKEYLAGRIEWVAKSKGDSEGYDILSFEESGKDRFIEVKTTRYGRFTPFFVSPNELRFCERHQSAYHLYRVFAFRQDPRMFSLPGSIENHCRLDPTEYRATLA